MYSSSLAEKTPSPFHVATILTPIEQVRVDVAAQGTYQTVHRTHVDDIVDDLRHERVGAILLSVSRYDPLTSARMATMVREFPLVPTFALLTDVQKSTPIAVHMLGQIGVKTLLDVRQPSGWSMLRERLARERPDHVQRRILTQLSEDLADVPSDCWRFFEVLFNSRPHVTTARHLARYLYVNPLTLMSRFYRVRLPSPKLYIDQSRLVYAAQALENSGLSINAMARQLEYSSAQAFSRHVRSTFHMSTLDFRQHFTGETMLQHFREQLILPYLEVLRTFHPVLAAPGWVSPSPGSSGICHERL